jgi:hypothetical protein
MSNPSSVAATAISADVGGQAPGWEYKLLLNGADYANGGLLTADTPFNAALDEILSTYF